VLPIDGLHKDLYTAALRRALDAFQAASVVHLDLRPENVMWSCSCETEMTDVDSSEIKHDFVLKVIDWEDAFFEGEVIPLHIVVAHINDEFQRYTLSQYKSPMGRDRILASCWMDHWMADTMAEFLSEDRGSLLWAEYMAARKEDPTVQTRVALSGSMRLGS